MPSLAKRLATLAAAIIGVTTVCVPLWLYWIAKLSLRSLKLRVAALTGTPLWTPPTPAGGVNDEPTIDGVKLEHLFVPGADGVKLHAVRVRVPTPSSRPLALYLHGFPEFWFSSKHIITALAADGYDAVAVDMRGYGLSDKPHGVRSYIIDRLVADTLALPTALGHAEGVIDVLVGHDWGGNVAWHAAAVGGEARVKKLVALAIPHPRAFLRNAGWTQAKRSYYMAVFQAPWLGEWMMAGDGGVAIASMTATRRGPVRPAHGEPALYAAAFLRSGVPTAAINYYRAMLLSQIAPSEGAAACARAVGRVPQQTLMIYGEHDAALGTELLTGTVKWVPKVQVHVLPTGHWPHLEDPETVVRLIRAFLKRD